MKKTSSRVPDQQARFVEAYFAKGENATQAYLVIKPHVTEKTANTEGCRLLANTKVWALVEKRRAELLQRNALTAERVYEEISGIVNFNPKRLLGDNNEPKPLHELADRDAAALEVVVENGLVRYRAIDKGRALEQAIKILRLTERPPPPPPDPADGQQVDMRDITRRLAFLLQKEAAENSAPQLPSPKKAA